MEPREPNYSPGISYIGGIQTKVSCIWHSKDDFFGETFGVLNVAMGEGGGGNRFRTKF